MFSDLGVMMLLHNPLLELQVIGNIEKVSVIDESILEFPLHAPDCVSLGLLQCLDHDCN